MRLCTSLEEAEEKLHQMDSDELNACVGDTSNWWSELSHSDEPDEEEESEHE